MFPGLGGMDPRRMKQLMRQMGIKSEEIGAKRVVFELAGGSKLVFEKPQVSAIDLGGQKTYTIIGAAKEEKGTGKGDVGSGEAGQEIPESDVDMVAEQAKASKEKARKALEETKGDIAEAIENLKK